jgi:uncharacterized protein
MLTKELAIAVYDKGEVFADCLIRSRHAHYEELAQGMLEIYATGIGKTRGELHLKVRDLFCREASCPVRRIGAFCKLLDEVSQFDRDRKRRAAALRRDVFSRAAILHPLVATPDSLFESGEAAVKQQIADQLGASWLEIDQGLFSDVLSHQQLMRFDGYPDGQALLARYNVAQAQAVLYRAESMTVWATTDLKVILRYAKLARLMHSLHRESGDVWRMEFSGPASGLRSTRRYGVQMAKFLPALIACRGWRMEATVTGGRGSWRNVSLFRLTSESGLRSSLPEPQSFDSALEARFATHWGAEPRDGWTLNRETEILHEGQRTFVPDFVFRRADGRQVLLEIAGYWTPEYLAAKRETMHRFLDRGVLLAVPGSLLDLPDQQWLREFPGLIIYKDRLTVTAVLQRLNSD